MKTGIIHTDRLIMKPLELSDASFMLHLLNAPNWLKYIGNRDVHNVRDAEDYLKKGSLKSLEEDGYGYYLLTDRSTQISVGICGLGKRDGLDETDLGYALLPKYEGMGYALESAQALIHEAKNAFGLKALMAITTETNKASIRLLRKLDFEFLKEASLNDSVTVFMHFRRAL